MKAATEAMKNEEMGSYKTFRFFNLPQKHYSLMLKTGAKAQAKQYNKPGQEASSFL
jgi:hypothetical protein